MPIGDYEQVINKLGQQGYSLISEVDHPIAKMAFLNTYQPLGLATEIMGIKPEDLAAIKQMQSPK